MEKSILITGCSSGIGLCAAQTLHKRGYRVFATTRKQADVEKLQELGLESLVLDVNSSESIAHAVNYILKKTGGTLGALFNNAGYAVPGAVEDLTRDMMREQFETNVFGPMELANRIIPIMRKQGYGRIIQNTSILGVIAMPYRGAYNASKFALEGFSQTLRQELKNTPIKISIIAPGPITTRFRENAVGIYDKTLRGKSSEHATTYDSMEKSLQGPPSKLEANVTLEPNAVVKQLIHALESNSPRARYYIGLPAHVFAFLRRMLPETWLDWIIAQSATDKPRS
jgi:short-subunit dehydrogenase